MNQLPMTFTFVHKDRLDFLQHASFKTDGCCVVTWEKSEYANGLTYNGPWVKSQIKSGVWLIIEEGE